MDEEELTMKRDILVFEIRGLCYGVELSFVAEIIRNPRISPMPWLPEYFVGVCSWKGGILPVVSLGLLTGGAEGESEAETGQNYAAAVLKSGEYECGLLTQQNPYILQISEENRLEGGEGDEMENGCYLAGRYQVDKEVVLLIDMEETLRRMVVCE